MIRWVSEKTVVFLKSNFFCAPKLLYFLIRDSTWTMPISHRFLIRHSTKRPRDYIQRLGTIVFRVDPWGRMKTAKSHLFCPLYLTGGALKQSVIGCLRTSMCGCCCCCRCRCYYCCCCCICWPCVLACQLSKQMSQWSRKNVPFTLVNKIFFKSFAAAS